MKKSGFLGRMAAMFASALSLSSETTSQPNLPLVDGGYRFKVAPSGLQPKKHKHIVAYYSSEQWAQLKKNERKVGRNELCLCGSGKKSKKCCA